MFQHLSFSKKLLVLSNLVIGLVFVFSLPVLSAQRKGKPGPEEKPSTTAKKKESPKDSGKDSGKDSAKSAAKKRKAEPRPIYVTRGASSIELIWVPPGEFVMGDDKGGAGETPAHPVKITKGFYLGKYEVTQAQWTAVMGDNLSQFRGPNLPVENVSWQRVQTFLERLNRLDKTYRYRLPTEAEWEYACRAGTTTEFAGTLDEMGWHANNLADDPAAQRPHQVGQKKPNDWGFYDMHGNVWEWCQDWLSFTYYTAELAVDPTGPPTGTTKVYRGGAWDQFPRAARSFSRYGDQTDHRDAALGFRVAADKRE